MSDKSEILSVPRELLQELDDLLYIMTGHDSFPRLVGNYGKECWVPVNEMRAGFCKALAAPAEDIRAVVDEPEIVAIVESALRRSFTLGQVYWQQADSESTRQQNKSDQTMETQSNHIAMVVKSIKSLIK